MPPLPLRGFRLLRPSLWYWLFALLPAVAVTLQIALHLKNIAFWDDFDAALAFIARLSTASTFDDGWPELTAMSEGHRMITSRLLVAGLWFLTATVDFRLLGWIGNAYLAGLFGLLVFAVPGAAARARWAAVLGLALFHLDHYESLFWSGSSLDHFLVPLLVAGTLRTLALPPEASFSRRRLLLAAFLALAAAFTLAHGLLTLPLGAALLALNRHRRAALGWTAFALTTLFIYFHGYTDNPVGGTPAGPGAIFSYTLDLLGAPLGGDHPIAGPVFGGLLLGLIAALAWIHRRSAHLSFFAIYVVWLLGAVTMIAVGRATPDGGGLLSSRYLVLPWLLWAIGLHQVLALFSPPHRWARFAPLAVFVLLTAGHLRAQITHWQAGATWAVLKRQAVTHYYFTGNLTGVPFTLYNQPEKGERILATASRLGFYDLPTRARLVRRPAQSPTTVADITYFVDEAVINERAVIVRGWIAHPRFDMRRARVRLVLRSAAGERRVYNVARVERPDVARVLEDDSASGGGFRFVLPRSLLPPGRYQIALIARHDDLVETITTDTWIEVPPHL